MKSSFAVFTASHKTLYGYLEVVLCLRKKKKKSKQYQIWPYSPAKLDANASIFLRSQQTPLSSGAMLLFPELQDAAS